MSSGSSTKNDAGGSQFKLLLLTLMVLQNSSTVLVGRYTRSGVPKDDQYEVNHLILVIEAAKFVMSCALEYRESGGRLLHSMNIHNFERPFDALKILIPALLYLIQNTLLYVALSNLTAPIFQVTYQGKLVTTALVSVIMLSRSYSFQQWVCLVVLSMGVAIVVLGEKEQDSKSEAEDAHKQNLFLGLVAVTIACFSSALAGVYFEKVLKKPDGGDATKQQPASLWMRNIQLAFFSVVIASFQGGLKPTVKPYFHGFSTWAWILVALQAGGGLLVAAVIKYADNVLKGLATGVSVVVATVVSILFFGTPLTGQFSVGAAMILASVYIFSNPITLGMSATKDTEMKTLLPK